jgi:hypothetical protein
VTVSGHADYKHKRINQNHNEGIGLRTETTINNTTDFEVGKRFLPPRGGRSVGFMKEKGTRGVALSLRRNAPVWTTPRTDDAAHPEHSGTDTTGATLSSSG